MLVTQRKELEMFLHLPLSRIVGLSLLSLLVIACGGQPVTPASEASTPAPIPTAVPTSIPTPSGPEIVGHVFRSDTNAPVVGAKIYLLEFKESQGGQGKIMVDSQEIDPGVVSDPKLNTSAHIFANNTTDNQGDYLLKDVTQGKYRMWMEIPYDNESQAPCYPFEFVPSQFANDPRALLLASMAFTPDKKWLTMYRKEGNKVTAIASLVHEFEVGSTGSQRYDIDIVCKR